MLSSITQSRWFELADLLLALICALAWAFFSAWGWAILAVAWLPWLVRLIAGQFPFRRTAFDLPVLLFLLTAGIGVWAAYDPGLAWEKFWWMIAACRLYYALATQPRKNFPTTATLITATAALLCLLFLLTFDWIAHPLLGPIDRLGTHWMAIRPNWPLPMPEPDFIGGLAAMQLPLVLVMAFDARQRRSYARLAAAIVIGLTLGLGLLMSAERPAWIGLLLAAGLWLGWQGCTWLARRLGYSTEVIAGVALIILLIGGSLPGVVLWRHYVSGTAMPGRVSEIINGAHLVDSYPLLGGGLAATPGLYSRYILGIPYLYIPNLHNQYLNIAIEQGLFGLGAIIWIFVGALLGLRPKAGAYQEPVAEDTQTGTFQPYRWAIGLGIVILAWHGLMEDVTYSNWGLILLLMLPGLAVSLHHADVTPSTPIAFKPWAVGAGVVAVLLVLGLRSLMAMWHANLGAVLMSRVQLAGWPDQLVDSEHFLAQIGPAERQFEQALIWQNQATANYRLGLIANERREFEHANTHLVTAFKQRPYHRGIHKALGYSYAWIGQIESAGQTLRSIPEAAYELGIYAQWWASQELSELSDYALQTADCLEKK